MGAEEFPFDPAADIHAVTGLDRLRCIADRGLAQVLYDLYWHAERNARRAPRREARAATRVGEVEARRCALRDAALAGKFGARAREFAEFTFPVGTDGRRSAHPLTLREFEVGLRALQKEGDPSDGQAKG